MLAKFLENQRLIAMSSINYLNYKKLAIYRNIWLIKNLKGVLRAKKISNQIAKFSKYIVILMILSKVVILDYNQIYS